MKNIPYEINIVENKRNGKLKTKQQQKNANKKTNQRSSQHTEYMYSVIG